MTPNPEMRGLIFSRAVLLIIRMNRVQGTAASAAFSGGKTRFGDIGCSGDGLSWGKIMNAGFFLNVLIFILVMAALIGLPLLLEGSVWPLSGRT